MLDPDTPTPTAQDSTLFDQLPVSWPSIEARGVINGVRFTWVASGVEMAAWKEPTDNWWTVELYVLDPCAGAFDVQHRFGCRNEVGAFTVCAALILLASGVLTTGADQ